MTTTLDASLRQPEGRPPTPAQQGDEADGSLAPWFRDDIEGLRAIAVIVVALNHTGLPLVGGGFIGVDVFFVISGFLITGLLLDDGERRQRPSIVAFYARRVRRILPLASFVLVTTMLATYAVAGTAVGNRTAVDGGWASIFLGNWQAGHRASDYFERDAITSPLLHFWSLAVEEQFYVVWPLLFVLIALLARSSRRRRRVGLVVLGAVCVASFVWSVHAGSTTTAYYSPLTRGWELGLGALLAMAMRGRKLLLAHGAAAVGSGLGLLLVLLSLVVVGPSTTYPGFAALLPTIGTVLILLGGSDGPSALVPRVLGAAPLRFVGERSYGFYLWHFPFLVVPTLWLGRDTDVPTQLALLVGAFAAACVTYVLVENPVRGSDWLRTVQPWVSLALGVVLVTVVLATSQVLQQVHEVTYHPPKAAPAAPGAGPDTAEVEAAVAAGVSLDTRPADLDPPADGIAEFGSLDADQAACDQTYATTRATPCFLGDLGSSRTVALWGDSHASMWLPALIRIADERGFRLAVFAKYGCAPLVGVTPWHPAENRPYVECTDYKESALRAIEKLAPDTVILTGAFRGWAYADGDDEVDGGVYTTSGQWIPSDTVDDVWSSRLGDSLEQLGTTGARLVVLGDAAYPLQDNAVCVGSHESHLSDCQTPAWAATYAAHNQVEADTAEQHGADYVPVTQWFCTTSQCPAVVDAKAVYRDKYHITRQYSTWLTAALDTALDLR